MRLQDRTALVANACLFLASGESSYVTGEILAVSGGVSPAL